MARTRLARRVASVARRAPTQVITRFRQAAPIVVRGARRARGVAMGVQLAPMAAGGTASLLYRGTGRLSSDPLVRAGILAGAAVILPGVPFARRLLVDVRGFAGAAGFALGQAIQAKWWP